MIVFIAGMPRSGSTFTFNIARELLERRGTVYHEPHFSILSVLERSRDANHIIVKAHSADGTTLRLLSVGAAEIICTFRKAEDAIASRMETFGLTLDRSMADMSEWVSMFRKLPASTLFIDFDEIEKHPIRTTIKIARRICRGAALTEAITIARKYSKTNVKRFADQLKKEPGKTTEIGESFYDIKTYFHRRHVSGIVPRSCRERVGEESVQIIREAYRNQLDERGYFHRRMQGTD